jgi:hypothetical protein
MMVGTVPTSIPQIILMANWLLELDFKRKWEQLRPNKLFWVLSSVFLIHLFGLIYTENIGAGLDDVRTKMPLMFLPLLFLSSKPLSQKEFYWVFYFFIAGTFVNTLWCIVYSFVLHTNEAVRNASRFMSHIRLGLYLNVAIATCVYFSIRSIEAYKKIGFVLLGLYFLFVLYVLGLASGLMNFVILFLLTLSIIIYRQKPVIKIAGIIIFIGFSVVVFEYVMKIKNAQLLVKPVATNELKERTVAGNTYVHFEETRQMENGNFIFVNLQPDELYVQWKKRFPEDSFRYSPAHNLQRYNVLLRYLASKGLDKDSAGLSKLNEQDIKNIKKNIPNYLYPDWNYLHQRTYELVNEYDEFMHDRFINGHSLTMRWYFWKAAVHSIRKNRIFGIGTGDVQAELNKTYVETRSPLDKEWYKRPHNQFLTITLALGIVGLFIFSFSIIYTAISLRRHLSLLFWPFFIIVVISFLLEDTLETQAGLTFFAFFNSLFVSTAWYKKRAYDSENT